LSLTPTLPGTSTVAIFPWLIGYPLLASENGLKLPARLLVNWKMQCQSHHGSQPWPSSKHLHLGRAQSRAFLSRRCFIGCGVENTARCPSRTIHPSILSLAWVHCSSGRADCMRLWRFQSCFESLHLWRRHYHSPGGHFPSTRIAVEGGSRVMLGTACE